jgi:hypothetical protein
MPGQGTIDEHVTAGTVYKEQRRPPCSLLNGDYRRRLFLIAATVYDAS